MRLLIVSPRFPPTNAADSQRVRMLLPYLAEQGCEAEVLAVEPATCTNEQDPWQADHLPIDLPIHRVRGLRITWSRIPGLGSLNARCHRALAKAGSRLLRSKKFDLVYISTTEFGCFSLGRLWKRRHGVPFVLDYQDPWVNDHYRHHPEIPPPGGRLKFAIVDALSRRAEPRVLREASGYTSVSSAYPALLQARYPFAASIPSLVVPFPASELDFSNLGSDQSDGLPFDPQDGMLHWVSIGRGGEDLHTALHGLFMAIKAHVPPELRKKLRLHFIGTSYAPAGRGVPTIAPLAAHYGLEEIVTEHTQRLPLSSALSAMKAASALIVLGSNDPSYTASKLNPYLLARKPLLAILHADCPGLEMLNSCGGGISIAFHESTPPTDIAEQIATKWLDHCIYAQASRLDTRIFQQFTASSQAKQLMKFWLQCLTSNGSS